MAFIIHNRKKYLVKKRIRKIILTLAKLKFRQNVSPHRVACGHLIKQNSTLYFETRRRIGDQSFVLRLKLRLNYIELLHVHHGKMLFPASRSMSSMVRPMCSSTPVTSCFHHWLLDSLASSRATGFNRGDRISSMEEKNSPANLLDVFLFPGTPFS